MSANDRQEGGEHYRRTDIQPWDIVAMFALDFFEGNVLKYLLRRKGDRLEDLQKARHYLDKKIELIEAERREEWLDERAAAFHVKQSDISDEP